MTKAISAFCELLKNVLWLIRVCACTMSHMGKNYCVDKQIEWVHEISRRVFVVVKVRLRTEVGLLRTQARPHRGLKSSCD